MSLFLFAAEALVQDYLNGRTMPRLLRGAVVSLVEARLIAGTLPVLDERLCMVIDDEAVAPRRS